MRIDFAGVAVTGSNVDASLSKNTFLAEGSKDFKQTLEKSSSKLKEVDRKPLNDKNATKKSKDIPEDKGIKKDDSTKVESNNKDNKQSEKVKDSEEVVEKGITTKEANDGEDLGNEVDKVLQEIANMLNISLEQLKETMVSKDFNLGDLNESQKVIEVLKDVYQCESNLDLLKIEGVSQALKEIQSLIEQQPENIQALKIGLEKQKTPEQVKNIEIDVEKADVNQSKANQVVDKSLDVQDQVSQNQENKSENKEHGQEQNHGKTEIRFENHLSLNAQVDKIGANNIAQSPLEEITKSEIAQQIVDKIKVNISKEVSKMTFQLNPEHLGKLQFSVQSKNGVMTANFAVENQVVKETIEANLFELKTTLQNQGIDVEEIEVHVANNDYFDERQQNNQHQGKKKKKAVRIADVDGIEDLEDGNEAEEMIQERASHIDYSA